MATDTAPATIFIPQQDLTDDNLQTWEKDGKTYTKTSFRAQGEDGHEIACQVWDDRRDFIKGLIGKKVDVALAPKNPRTRAHQLYFKDDPTQQKSASGSRQWTSTRSGYRGQPVPFDVWLQQSRKVANVTQDQSLWGQMITVYWKAVADNVTFVDGYAPRREQTTDAAPTTTAPAAPQPVAPAPTQKPETVTLSPFQLIAERIQIAPDEDTLKKLKVDINRETLTDDEKSELYGMCFVRGKDLSQRAAPPPAQPAPASKASSPMKTALLNIIAAADTEKALDGALEMVNNATLDDADKEALRTAVAARRLR